VKNNNTNAPSFLGIIVICFVALVALTPTCFSRKLVWLAALSAVLVVGVRNFFENTAAVQFDHRILAYTTATAVVSMWALARANPAVYAALPGPTKVALNAALGMTAAQVALGITALLNYVPVELGEWAPSAVTNLYV
jgi:heme A synthase